VAFFLGHGVCSMLPESPRWLLVQRKYESAEHILRSMAKVNGAELPPDFDVRHIDIVSIGINVRPAWARFGGACAPLAPA